MFQQLFKNWSGTGRSKARRNTAQLRVEPLEDRVVPSTFELVAGQLRITGTDRDDRIEVVESDRSISVRVTTGSSSQERSFEKRLLTHWTPIVIRGVGGHDHINASSVRSLRVYVEGGSGNDIIYASEGHDVLFGDDGHDEIHGEAGNDVIFGGAGDDSLHGGRGDDHLFG